MEPSVGRRAALFGAVLGGMIAGAGAGAAGAAAQVVPASPAPSRAPTNPDEIDPNAPLAPLPELGLDWPDLATAPGADTPAARPAADTRYEWRIDGIDGVGSDLFRQRFRELSVLAQNEGRDTNPAQLDRRARQDAELLVTLLRGEGYYDAAVTTAIESGQGRPTVVLRAEPGGLYRFAGVTVAGVEAAGDKADTLREAFPIRPEDPVNADAVAAAEASLRARVGEEGFPFATVGDPEIVVDRAARTATLAVNVAPGSERRIGGFVAAPGNRLFDARHVAEISRMKPGETFTQSDLDDLKRALIQTGLVSTAEVTPVPGRTADTVDIRFRLEPAPPRTIAGEVGYGTGEGARVELSWTHRNLFPPEGGLTARGVLGTREQLGSLVYRRNNFRGRDRVLTAQFAAAHLERDAYEADTLSLSGSLEQQTNIFFQKTWTWSLSAELVASDERDVIASTGQPRRRTFLIGALPTSLGYDGSDDLLNPTRGFRLAGRLSPELSLQGAAFGYTRIQLDASGYQPVTPRVVAAGRVRLGTILGAPRDQVAPSRRFYAGGGASVRGYAFQSIGPRDPNNDPIGGRSLAEFALEARVRLFGSFGIVPFLDGGNIYTGGVPDFSGFRFGTGIGVRYYSNFGPIRVDVGTPINPQPGDSRLAVYVSLGQAF